jgi:mRNA interferase RelE/StbE
MGSYRVDIRPSAEREIRSLPGDVRARVVKAILALEDVPRPSGCLKMEGLDAWRLRVGAYRIVYTIEDRVLTIEVVRVAHRREDYRRR